MPVKTPQKPFPSYKWLWASVQPSEGLNAPPVYLGVLRALRDNDGDANGGPAVISELAKVKADTGTKVDHARTGDRNLIRNSGQYWKVFGLLEPTVGVIQITDFGKKVADGDITQTEFASTVVRTLSLPSSAYSPAERDKWISVNLRIKPLDLILRILLILHQNNSGWITNDELTRIVIPLAGEGRTPDEHAEAILEFRRTALSLTGWPNCVPGANDTRISREFLLFLANYGFVREDGVGTRDTARFSLISPEAIRQLLQVSASSPSRIQVAAQLRQSDFPAQIERQRVMVEILARPQQARFRREVTKVCGGQCLVTGTRLPDVLEAAHIRPVRFGGDDSQGNGLLFRSDIHLLFDAGHLKVHPTGAVVASTAVQSDPVYSQLPSQINLPTTVDQSLLRWRLLYL